MIRFFSGGGFLRQSAQKLKKSKAQVKDDNVVIADVTDPASLAVAMQGIEEVVLCTSAVPKVGVPTRYAWVVRPASGNGSKYDSAACFLYATVFFFPGLCLSVR